MLKLLILASALLILRLVLILAFALLILRLVPGSDLTRMALFWLFLPMKMGSKFWQTQMA